MIDWTFFSGKEPCQIAPNRATQCKCKAYGARHAAALAPAAGHRLSTVMRVLWLLLVTLPVEASDPLSEIRARGAELESAHRWEEAASLYRLMLGQAGSCDDRFWLLTSLAEVEFERQDYAQSKRWLHQAAETIEGLTTDAPERIRLLNAWGALHLVEGNLTAAERELSRAVELGEPVAPPEDRAAALHNLAAVEMHRNRLAEAFAHEAQALALWRERFGDRHYYVMKAWISLSSVEGLRGDWRAAAQSLERALAISDSDEALSNYAIVLDKLKRHKEARGIRQKLQQLEFTSLPVVDVNGFSRRDALVTSH
jgi:tetratricopeptide (TPR) repeat protein